jgi:hypothetical protein
VVTVLVVVVVRLRLATQTRHQEIMLPVLAVTVLPLP